MSEEKVVTLTADQVKIERANFSFSSPSSNTTLRTSYLKVNNEGSDGTDDSDADGTDGTDTGSTDVADADGTDVADTDGTDKGM